MKEGGATESEETTKSKVLSGSTQHAWNIPESDLGRTRNAECEAGRFAVRTQGSDRAGRTAAMTEGDLDSNNSLNLGSNQVNCS